MATNTKPIKAAVVQAEPVWFDLSATISKTCKLIAQASSNGAEIIAFPECWLPGYPTWIWAPGRAMDFATSTHYTKNSLVLDSDEMKRLQKCAKENNIVVCLGYSELRGKSIYIGQCTIDSTGELVMTRRKLKPVHLERTLFGDGHGPSLNNVATTSVGQVGQLSCGDHYNPLLTMNGAVQGEEIHVSAWPPAVPFPGAPAPYSMSAEAVAAVSSVYAMQTQCFVLHSTAIVSEASIKKFGLEQTGVFSFPGGGNAKIFAPDGRQLTEDLSPMEEGMVYEELNFDEIAKNKGFLDTVGHNSRPELIWLGRNVEEQGHVTEARSKVSKAVNDLPDQLEEEASYS